MVTWEWEGLLALPRLAHAFRCDGDKLVAVPHGLVLLRKWELALQGGGGGVIRVSEGGGNRKLVSVTFCLDCRILTNSPSSLGTRTFISELLALMTSQLRESLLRYTWQPSVLLMEMVGTFPMT